MFERIVCLNLPERIDRWGSFLEKIKDFDWKDKVVHQRAIHGDTVGVPHIFRSGGPAFGCRQSHLRAIEDALMDGVETLCVFEDDVVFIKGFQEGLNHLLEILPEDWEGIMLGGQRMRGNGPVVVPGVLRAMNSTRTHAYVIRGTEPLKELHRIWSCCDTHIDHWNWRWQSRLEVYEPEVWLCGQDEGYSNIAGRSYERRYWSNRKSSGEVGNSKVVHLITPKQVAQACVSLGVHYGYSKDPESGRDQGMIRMAKRFYPPEELRKWIDCIQGEAFDTDCLPCIWEPGLPPDRLRDVSDGISFHEIRAETLGDVLEQLPPLKLASLARDAIWLWKGSDRLTIEALAYNGFHIGFSRDQVTGLDQGVRAAMTKQAMPERVGNLIKVARTLHRQCGSILRGKPLLIHPDLPLPELASALNSHGMSYRVLTGDTKDGILTSFWDHMDLIRESNGIGER